METITAELLTGTFTIAAEGKTYTGITNILPENFFDGSWGKEYENDVLNEICEEQDYAFIADNITDWNITR